MSLALSSNANALAPGLYTYFFATGGTSPYSYAVLAGGAGGSINSVSGLYTAPLGVTGEDTIQVTDNVGALAQASVLVCNAIELFCNVIQTEMGLSQGQVYLWDQKINIPPDHRLYVAVGVMSCKPFSNNTRFNSDGTATQSTNFRALLSVDLISRGPDARDRKEELVMALNSIYSQSQQEINSFGIGIIPSEFLNLSEVDGAAIPYRFNLAVGLQYFVSKTKSVPYYDSFVAPSVTLETPVYPPTPYIITEGGDHITTEGGDKIISTGA